MQELEHCAAGTTSMPSGLQRADATLATNFVGATPTLQVSPSSRETRSRICSAITAGRPWARTAPDTSRNASSSESGSTSGVTSRRIAITALDAAVYAARSGRTTTAPGHSRNARVIGIALRTPYLRAS